MLAIHVYDDKSLGKSASSFISFSRSAGVTPRCFLEGADAGLSPRPSSVVFDMKEGLYDDLSQIICFDHIHFKEVLLFL